MVALGPRPRDLTIPSERAVVRRVRVASAALFVAFLFGSFAAFGLLSAIGAESLAGVVYIGVLGAYGASFGYLLWRAGRRELALIRTTTVLFQDLPVGVVFLDESGKVTYANPALSRMSGRTLEEVRGVEVAAFIHPEDKPRLERELRRRASGEVSPYELRVLRKDGNLLRTVITAIPLMDGDRYDGALAVVHDVTDVLEARARADRYQELSAFALDAVTHDLSNRMQAVVARTGIAAALLPAEASRSKEALATAAEAADRAGQLIKEVKQIAAAERENWPKRTLEITALVDRAIAIADVPVPLQVEAEVLPEAAAARVEASDLAPLVLSKLLEQAAEGASPARGGGKLLLAVSVESAPEPQALMRVHGFNRTVSDDDLKLMLAAPREAAGRELPWRSGVKLSLAAAVAQAHGWGVRAVRDKDGKGTIFEVRIPLQHD